MNGVKKRLQKKYPQKPNFLLKPITEMIKQSPRYTAMAVIMAFPRDSESARIPRGLPGGCGQKPGLDGSGLCLCWFFCFQVRGKLFPFGELFGEISLDLGRIQIQERSS